MTSDLSGRTILFVDDFASLADTARFLLEDLGCRVIVAGSLAEAQLATAEAVDVAVLDVSLPDGDGSELIAPLRAKYGPVGIVMMSGGYHGREEPGDVEYLPKPFLRDDLERAVSAALKA